MLTPGSKTLGGRKRTDFHLPNKHEATSSAERRDEEGLGRRYGSSEGRKLGMK